MRAVAQMSHTLTDLHRNPIDTITLILARAIKTGSDPLENNQPSPLLQREVARQRIPRRKLPVHQRNLFARAPRSSLLARAPGALPVLDLLRLGLGHLGAPAAVPRVAEVARDPELLGLVQPAGVEGQAGGQASRRDEGRD